MAAVTSIMRAQQILLARLNELLRPVGLTFPRYEALMLLSFTRRGALPLGKIGERLQVHRTASRTPSTGSRSSSSCAASPTSATAARPRRDHRAGREVAERATARSTTTPSRPPRSTTPSRSS